jgi:hypothetical protein
MCDNLQRIIELFTHKLSLSSQKKYRLYGVRDPEKTYSRSRIRGQKGNRMPEPQHCSNADPVH